MDNMASMCLVRHSTKSFPIRWHLHILMEHLILFPLAVAHLHFFNLLPIHVGNLEQDSGFAGFDLIWTAENTILFISSHPSCRQVKMLLFIFSHLFEIRRWEKKGWAVKDLYTALFDHLTELSVEFITVDFFL